MPSRRIVIPRALHYHYFHPFWKTFFENIGCETAVTPPTNREILDAGVRASLSDICLPLKAYMGHVQRAASMGDEVFVPRLVSKNANRYYCPKFLALPDLVRAKAPGLPILSVEINAKKGPDFTRLAFLDLGRRLGASRKTSEEALQAARQAQQRHETSCVSRFRKGEEAYGPRIALVGHPYTIHDAYLSSGMTEWLESAGARLVTCESVPEEVLERAEAGLFREVYWESAHILVQCAVHDLSRSDLEGIILLSAFGCGPDSFVADIVARRARRKGNIPFVRLLIDEHTARAGLRTRLEAFLDMATAFRRRQAD